MSGLVVCEYRRDDALPHRYRVEVQTDYVVPFGLFVPSPPRTTPWSLEGEFDSLDRAQVSTRAEMMFQNVAAVRIIDTRPGTPETPQAAVSRPNAPEAGRRAGGLPGRLRRGPRAAERGRDA